MLLADFEKDKRGYKGNWKQGGNYPSEQYTKKGEKSGDPSINLYDPAGYGTGSYGFYPPYQRKSHTKYKMGGDKMMVYGTDGFGSHNNIGLRGYLTRSLNNDVMQHGDYMGRNLPDEAIDAYTGSKNGKKRNVGSAQNHGIQQWLRGKDQQIDRYRSRFKKRKMQQSYSGKQG